MNNKNVEFEVESGRVFASGRCIAKLNYSERLILSYLVSNSGVIVSKDTLLNIGWPGRIVVPNSLNIAIRTIRDVLQSVGIDSEPETIPKHGYKLSRDIVIVYQPPSETLVFLKNDEGLSKVDKEDELNSQVNSDEVSVVDGDELLSDTIYKKKENTIKAYSSGLYKLYLAAILTISIIVYMYISLHKPKFVCTPIKNSVFCGADVVDINEITFPFNSGDLIWFAQTDGVYSFVKVN
ncbi:winged helix-turn-helix domain-containing protein [Aeromonas salmonicida]